MESNNPARSASYSKLNDWNNSNKAPFVARRSKLPKWKCVFVIFVIVLCIIAIGLGIGFGLRKINEKCIPESASEQVVGVYSKAAVSSLSPNCSIVGKNILLKNGSAVDAAIAAMLCESVASPQSTGLGGGFFMMVYSKAKGTLEVIDARETAPLKADPAMYKEKNSTLYGGLAVAVPGELKGYQLAHETYGHLNWSDLFQPAIQMCREGVPVSPRLANALKSQNSASLRQLFVKNDTGKWVDLGDVYYCHKLAETYETIAEEGADVFYTGEVGRLMLQDLESFGGIITEDDLKNYKAVVRDPIEFKLSDGIQVFTMPPPGGGLVLGLLMQILDQIALNETYGLSDMDDLLWAHYFVEACKYAYAKRAEIGDPSGQDMTELIKMMTSPHIAERIRNNIQADETFGTAHYEAMFMAQDDHGTSQVTVLAPNGDAVTITSTVNLGFGAEIYSPSTGIIFNNEMDDFSVPSRPNAYGLAPSQANSIQPGKRPASTMAPAIVLDNKGELMYVLGAVGGSKIVSALAYVYLLHEYRNTSLEDAIRSKRLHHQLIPNKMEYEEGFDQVILEGLKSRGHDLTLMNKLTMSGVYIIYRNAADNSIVAGADHRRNSAPAGF